MKTFAQLTEDQQKKAIDKCLTSLLTAIVEGRIRFSDKHNNDDLQARIDKAMERAEKMQTPWFAHEYVMDTCKDELEGMARVEAEDAMYSEDSEHVVNGIA